MPSKACIEVEVGLTLASTELSTGSPSPEGEGSFPSKSGIGYAVELKDNIAPLVVSGITDEGARKYDILLTNIELSYIDADVNAEGL